jgi:hypothetical protein
MMSGIVTSCALLHYASHDRQPPCSSHVRMQNSARQLAENNKNHPGNKRSSVFVMLFHKLSLSSREYNRIPGRSFSTSFLRTLKSFSYVHVPLTWGYSAGRHTFDRPCSLPCGLVRVLFSLRFDMQKCEDHVLHVFDCMHLCVCVRVCVCMPVYMYVCIYIYTYIYCFNAMIC